MATVIESGAEDGSSGLIFRACEVSAVVYEKGTVDVYLRGAAKPIEFRNIDPEAWAHFKSLLLKGMKQKQERGHG